MLRLFATAMLTLLAGNALFAKAPQLQRPGQLATNDCPAATSQFTRRDGIWSDNPAKPKKLTDLPPAESYAAVYRLDERGCMVPVKFRDVRR